MQWAGLARQHEVSMPERSVRHPVVPMNAGFDRIRSGHFAATGEGTGASRSWTGNAVWLRRGVLWLLAAIIVGCGVWLVTDSSEGNVTTGELVKLALASVDPAAGASPPADHAAAATVPSAAQASAAAGLDHLRISSQTWRRGGLGSKALVSFTLRNDNDYAVKDVEIACAFTRRDGSHLTDRGRVIADTVSMKSRKTFAHVPVGFVNVNADQAKCSLIAARRA
jgi:hypothetical protein